MVANQYPGKAGASYCLDQDQQRLKPHRRTPASPYNRKPYAFSAERISTAIGVNNRGMEKEHIYPLLSALLKVKKVKTPFGGIQHCGSHDRSQQMNSSRASLNSVQPKRQRPDHIVVNVNPPELHLSSSFFSGLLLKEPPTDEQIMNFINERLEPYKSASTLEHRNAIPSNKNLDFCTVANVESHCSIPKTNSFIHVPTPPISNEENVERQDSDKSVSWQYNAAGRQALQKDSSRSSKANASLTLKSKVGGDNAALASDKRLTGTGTPHVIHVRHSSKNESFKRNASIECNLKERLDVTLPAKAYGKLVYSDDCEDQTVIGRINEELHSVLVKYIENDIATLHYSLNALKELIASLENVEITANVENLSEVILQQFWNGDLGNIHLFTSTEYPQIMRNVAATCTKSEEDSPVILAAVSGIALDEATKKNISCSSPQEEYRSTWLNTNKTLDDIDKGFGVSWAPWSTIGQEKKETNPEVVETLRLDNVKRGTYVPVENQTNSTSVVSKNDTMQPRTYDNARNRETSMDLKPAHITVLEVKAHSDINLSVQIQSIIPPANQSQINMRENAHSLASQGGLDGTLCENKGKAYQVDQEEQCVNLLLDPQYEDISDDEGILQQATQQACIKDLQYQDISEDETPQIKIKSVETRCLAEVLNNDQPTCKYKGKGQVLDQAQRDADDVAPLYPLLPETERVKVAKQSATNACTSFAEPDDGFKNLSIAKCNSKKHLGGQTSQPVSPNTFDPKKGETDSEMDDSDSDDEWMVFPVSMVDIHFETNEEHGNMELVVLHPGKPEVTERQDAISSKQCRLEPDPEQAQTTASLQMEVFDTFDSFVKAKREQFGFCRSTAPNKLDPVAEPYNAQKRSVSHSEPEDSFDTEDSSDYSSTSEHNLLTVDGELLKAIPVLASPNVDSSSSKDKSEPEGTNAQKSQTRRSKLHKIKERLANWLESKKKLSQTSDIIILDSDTDDESDQKCKTKPKGFSLDSKDCVHQSNVSPEQVVINLDSDTDSVSLVDNDNTRSAQLLEAREQIQQETNKATPSKSKVFLHSDKVVKKMPTMARAVSSGSDESSSAELASKTVNGSCRTNSKKPQTTLPAKEKRSQPEGKKDQTTKPVIVCLGYHQSGSYIQLSKRSKSTVSTNKTLAPKIATATKSASGNDRHDPPNKHPASVKKPKPVTRQMSLPGMGRSAAVVCNSSSPSNLPFSFQARKRSASDGLSTSVRSSPKRPKPSTSVPSTRSHTDSNTSISQHPKARTKDLSSSASPSSQSFARKRVRREWNESFFPTKMDRRSSLGTEELLRSPTRDLNRHMSLRHNHEGRQPAPRHRHNSNKPATPLMKRTKLEAIQRTKDINRTTSSRQSNVVGKNYKWAEERRRMKASNWRRNRH